MNRRAVDWSKVADEIVDWMRQQAEDAGASGVVYGLSGGVDSAVVGVLCRRAFADNSLALVLPCRSESLDLAHASMIIEKFDLEARVVPLDRVHTLFLGLIKNQVNDDASRLDLASANLKPRLRMAALYFFANMSNYLVVGTSNQSELAIGYFTKHGDGAADILPIGCLYKTEVWDLARYLGVPDKIVDKPPAAGLLSGQTDEGELGFSYEDLDRYLITGEAGAEIKRKIDDKIALSEHKRRLPPIPRKVRTFLDSG